MKKNKNLIRSTAAMILSLSMISGTIVTPVMAEEMSDISDDVIMEDVRDASTEELLAVEDISDNLNNEVAPSKDISYEVPLDEAEEDVLGDYVDTEKKDWGNGDYIRHRYLSLNKGNTVIVTPCKDLYWDGVNGHAVEYRVKDYTVAYDAASGYMYGIMSLPDLDNGRMPSAFVRIPDTQKVEVDTEYEAEFLFDVDRELGHGYSDYTIQIIGQRVYLFIRQNYAIVSPETKTDNNEPFVNMNYIYLLYSTDMNGGDIKLHMREAYAFYDSTADKRPAWLYSGDTPRAVQKIDGKWYALMLKADKQYEKIELADGTVTESKDGFMSPADEWFKLEKRYGKDYLDRGEDGSKTNDTITTYDQMMYVRQWMYDNGYTKNLYVTSQSEAKKDKNKETKELEKEQKEKEKNNPIDLSSLIGETVSADMVYTVKDRIDINKYLGKATGKVRYVSSDKKIASAKKNGLITTKSPGKAIIIRQIKEGKAWKNYGAFIFTVSKPFTILPGNTLEIKQGSDKTYDISDYIINDSDVQPTYTVAGSGSGIIGNDPLKITPAAAGKATINAKFNNYVMKIKVVVNP